MFTLEENAPWTLMPCAEYEDRILDLHHGQLDAGARRRVEEHLTDCLACRRFADDLQSLDAALDARLRCVALPASFKANLLRRIDAEAPRLAPELIARRRQALESEFRAASGGLLKRVVRERWSSILDGLGLIGIALLIALGAEQLAPQTSHLVNQFQGAVSGQTALYATWAAGTLCLVGAVWLGLDRNARRVLYRL